MAGTLVVDAAHDVQVYPAASRDIGGSAANNYAVLDDILTVPQGILFVFYMTRTAPCSRSESR